MHDLFPFAFLSIASIALFSFLTVSSWTDGRRKEREAYYKAETMKRLTEAQGSGAATVLEILREEEHILVRRRRDGTRLGGLVTLATGLGLGIFLHAMVTEAPVYLIGVIPLLVGAALLLWSYLFTSQE